MNYKCKYCLLKSSEKLIDEFVKSDKDKELVVNKLFKYLSEIDSSVLTPELARQTHHIITDIIGPYDPCVKEKKNSNDLALLHYEKLKEKINTSSQQFDTALRLSIAGNIMDFGANPDFFNDSEKYFNETINKVLSSDFAIDDSLKLQDEIDKAETILYLGDNSGEIVMDKLFLETIDHANVYFAVRGMPVMNDATFEDAEYVKIGKYAKVISNGYDAPSTILDKCSDEFIDIYNKANLIISKGQGNFEGLCETTDKRLFFLLMIKCDMIANEIGIKKGDFVVMNNGFVIKN